MRQRQSHILLVDDDKDVLMIFKKALELSGYRVGAYSSPKDALEHFRANAAEYDLLLTDVGMSGNGMSGFELAKQFKALNQEIRILFSTGYDLSQEQLDKELEPLSLSSPNSSWGPVRKHAIIIPKPAKLELIIASVRDALSNFSSLIAPSDNEHIVLLYSDAASYDDVISLYINAGLERDQLCTYTYLENDAHDAMSRLSTSITDYEENIRKGNILLVDFKPFCATAIANNLERFEQLMALVKKKIQERNHGHARIVGRAAGWLYENQYFEQCLALEQWWYTKTFTGSLVCPYKMSIFEHKQFFEHRNSLFVKHDTILRI